MYCRLEIKKKKKNVVVGEVVKQKHMKQIF